MRPTLIAVAFVLFGSLEACLFADEMAAFTGRTMGTTYSVKIFGRGDDLDDVPAAVDRELRAVNDQMSTYLKSSELSRFNASVATDWFEVSRDTAMVVDFALRVAALSEGAFDPTIGPLVDLWSFGAGERSYQVPTDGRIAAVSRSLGYSKIEARLDPPALRKSDPDVELDLSAIAKGHGVDRVVELLNDRGLENVFVEIGGEVRTSGDKNGQWWKVGIQLPDRVDADGFLPHALSTPAGDGSDAAMATSGDYRNFFEVDGKRYSHTIDPRTGRPVDHALASVSVVADTCMKADAWATAINVLGPVDGLKAARAVGLDVLLIERDGDQPRFSGTGALANVGRLGDAGESSDPVPEKQRQEGVAGNQLIATAILTSVVFAVLLAAMAVGVLAGRKSIAGSCGGVASVTNEDGTTSCSLCNSPSEACKELRQKMDA